MKKWIKFIGMTLLGLLLVGVSNTNILAKTKHLNVSNIAKIHKAGKYHFNGYSKKYYVTYNKLTATDDINADPIKVTKVKYQVVAVHNTKKDTAETTGLPIPDDANVKKGATTYYLFMTGTVANTASKEFAYNGLIGGDSAVLPDNEQVDITGLNSLDDTRDNYQANTKTKTGTSVLFLGTKKISKGV